MLFCRYFNYILLIENVDIFIDISLNNIPEDPSDNKPALVEINGLAPKRCHAIIWTSDGLVYRRIYVCAFFSLNELTTTRPRVQIHGFMKDCSISIANAL